MLFNANSIAGKEGVDHIPVEDNPVYMISKKIDLKKTVLMRTCVGQSQSQQCGHPPAVSHAEEHVRESLW